MINLWLAYIVLFMLAGALGMVGGWLLREFVSIRQRRVLESDLGEIRRLGQPAPQPQPSPAEGS